jgi:hypothetical protein
LVKTTASQDHKWRQVQRHIAFERRFRLAGYIGPTGRQSRSHRISEVLRTPLSVGEIRYPSNRGRRRDPPKWRGTIGRIRRNLTDAVALVEGVVRGNHSPPSRAAPRGLELAKREGRIKSSITANLDIRKKFCK